MYPQLYIVSDLYRPTQQIRTSFYSMNFLRIRYLWENIEKNMEEENMIWGLSEREMSLLVMNRPLPFGIS